jgi:hypothetical protein
MSESHPPDAEDSPPLPAAVRTVLVEAIARALIRDLRLAGVLPQPTKDSCESDANQNQEEINVQQR